MHIYILLPNIIISNYGIPCSLFGKSILNLSTSYLFSMRVNDIYIYIYAMYVISSDDNPWMFTIILPIRLPLSPHEITEKIPGGSIHQYVLQVPRMVPGSQGPRSCSAILVSFLWGAIGPAEVAAPLGDVTATVGAVLLLVAGRRSWEKGRWGSGNAIVGSCDGSLMDCCWWFNEIYLWFKCDLMGSNGDWVALNGDSLVIVGI